MHFSPGVGAICLHHELLHQQPEHLVSDSAGVAGVTGPPAALRPRPAVTVVLTDGYTPWPAAPPKGMRVVVGLLGLRAPDAPLWARAVRVEAE